MNIEEFDAFIEASDDMILRDLCRSTTLHRGSFPTKILVKSWLLLCIQ
jgi:hypothetical protein